MSPGRILKRIHFSSTAWFVLSAGVLWIWALRQAGKSWWIIVSLSGHSALLIFLLISLYLFAVYRGVSRSLKSSVEHPLTRSIYYSVFYDVSPFLGAIAGAIAAINSATISYFVLVVATGSLWTTFLVWILVDPLAGMAEMLLPSSRVHRRQRLLEAKATRRQEQLAKERLFVEIEEKEQQSRILWDRLLQGHAEKLAQLVIGNTAMDRQRETEAVDIGVNAWQTGRLSCMRQLHSMAMDICRQNNPDARTVDYISVWWDGIGGWRSAPLAG